MDLGTVIAKSILPASIGEWETLLSRASFPNPFLTPTWFGIWETHFGHSRNPEYILFRHGPGPLVGIGVFSAETEEGGQKGLHLLGSNDVCDYRDVLVSRGHEPEVFDQLGKLFRDGPWKFLDLQGISEFSPTLHVLPGIMESFGFRVSTGVEEVALRVELPPSWEGFLEGLNSKDRHELRRKMRRLEREGSFEEEMDAGASSLDERMGAFLELHRQSRQDKAQFMNEAMEAFFRDLAGRFQEKGWLRLPFLKIGGERAAVFLSFDYAGTEYVYNSGYNPQFSRFSPGILLAALCIRRAIEKGMKGFHFLRGKEDYKYRLGGKEERIYRIRVDKP